MKVKFKRYKINYKKKYYYIFIPYEYDSIWLIDWADTWYGGAWIEANIRCMKYVLACFCILAYNPYAIVYFPIRKNRRPNTFAYRDHCEYDVIFKTTRIWIKDKDLRKIIKESIKYTKYTTYNCKINVDRMKCYFKDNISKIDKIPSYKILVNADNHINKHIAFYTFPQIWYQYCSIDTCEYFFDVINKKEWSSYYDEKYDNFSCPFTNFIYYGKRKSKFTYMHPPLTLYLELYDLDVLNCYMKEKVYLVDNNKLI